MLIVIIQDLLIILLGIMFAYLYGYIEHDYIPPAEHLRLRFFHHFANYHLIMFTLFSALPLVVLVFQPDFRGLLLGLGLWTYLPLGEDMAWYHFAGTWPTPQDWTSWNGGYYFGKRWIPKWYILNGTLTVLFFGAVLVRSGLI